MKFKSVFLTSFIIAVFHLQPGDVASADMRDDFINHPNGKNVWVIAGSETSPIANTRYIGMVLRIERSGELNELKVKAWMFKDIVDRGNGKYYDKSTVKVLRDNKWDAYVVSRKIQGFPEKTRLVAVLDNKKLELRMNIILVINREGKKSLAVKYLPLEKDRDGKLVKDNNGRYKAAPITDCEDPPMEDIAVEEDLLDDPAEEDPTIDEPEYIDPLP